MADDEKDLKELDDWKSGPTDMVDGLNECLKVQNALVRAVKKLIKDKPKKVSLIARNKDNDAWRRFQLLGFDVAAAPNVTCDCPPDGCGCDPGGSGEEDVGES